MCQNTSIVVCLELICCGVGMGGADTDELDNIVIAGYGWCGCDDVVAGVVETWHAASVTKMRMRDCGVQLPMNLLRVVETWHAASLQENPETTRNDIAHNSCGKTNFYNNE